MQRRCCSWCGVCRVPRRGQRGESLQSLYCFGLAEYNSGLARSPSSLFLSPNTPLRSNSLITAHNTVSRRSLASSPCRLWLCLVGVGCGEGGCRVTLRETSRDAQALGGLRRGWRIAVAVRNASCGASALPYRAVVEMRRVWRRWGRSEGDVDGEGVVGFAATTGATQHPENYAHVTQTHADLVDSPADSTSSSTPTSLCPIRPRCL